MRQLSLICRSYHAIYFWCGNCSFYIMVWKIKHKMCITLTHAHFALTELVYKYKLKTVPLYSICTHGGKFFLMNGNKKKHTFYTR